MGGMGFIHTAECDIMHNSALINVHMIDTAAKLGVGRYFFSSSACVYPNMKPGDPKMTEDQVIPANPDNEYGWEKLYAERMAQAYARHYLSRFGSRASRTAMAPMDVARRAEKAPAANLSQVAETPNGGTIDVWGMGRQSVDSPTLIDLVDGIFLLMQSDLRESANIGTEEYVTVKTWCAL